MMTKEEAIEVLKTYDMSEDNDDVEFKEAIAMAIGSLEGNTAFLKVTFDRDELQRCVDKAKEEIKTGIIAGFIDDLNEIYQELWNIDIPSPTVPEYKEHHEQIQGIMAVVKEKLKKYQESESEGK